MLLIPCREQDAPTPLINLDVPFWEESITLGTICYIMLRARNFIIIYKQTIKK
jgi:hypothetical protein